MIRQQDQALQEVCTIIGERLGEDARSECWEGTRRFAEKGWWPLVIGGCCTIGHRRSSRPTLSAPADGRPRGVTSTRDGNMRGDDTTRDYGWATRRDEGPMIMEHYGCGIIVDLSQTASSVRPGSSNTSDLRDSLTRVVMIHSWCIVCTIFFWVYIHVYSFISETHMTTSCVFVVMWYIVHLYNTLTHTHIYEIRYCGSILCFHWWMLLLFYMLMWWMM